MRSSLLILALVVGLLACSSDKPTGLSFDDQLKKDITEIDQYLAANSIVAITDPSGVRYLVAKTGTGALPGVTDQVYVTVVGKILSTGKVFFDSQDKYTNVPLNSSNLLPSWQTVIPLIKKGSSFTIFSPSGLAYGAIGLIDFGVPGNTNVTFDMKLFDEVDQFKQDTASIKTYLNTNKIVAVKDQSGVSYVISSPGTGNKPIASSTVTFNYEGKLLTTGETFDKSSGAPISIALTGIIKGLQIGFPLLATGGKATFYIPSSLGYGPVDISKIPGNSVLIFDVELVSFQ